MGESVHVFQCLWRLLSTECTVLVMDLFQSGADLISSAVNDSIEAPPCGLRALSAHFSPINPKQLALTWQVVVSTFSFQLQNLSVPKTQLQRGLPSHQFYFIFACCRYSSSAARAFPYSQSTPQMPQTLLERSYQHQQTHLNLPQGVKRHFHSPHCTRRALLPAQSRNHDTP